MVTLHDKFIKTDKVAALLRYNDGTSLWTTLSKSELEVMKKNPDVTIVSLEPLRDDFSK